MQHNLEFLSSEGRYKRRKLFWHSIGPICRKRCSCRRSSCLHRSWSCSWRRQPPNAVTKFDDFYQKEKLFRLKILKWKITCNRRPCPTQHLLRHFRAYKSRLRPTGRSKAKRRTTWLSRRLMTISVSQYFKNKSEFCLWVVVIFLEIVTIVIFFGQ